MNQPKRAGRAGGIILLAFLSLFALTNFLTVILAAATAGEYWKQIVDLMLRNNTGPVVPSDPWPFPDPRISQGQLQTVSGPIELVNDPARPYVILTVLAGITWVITSTTLLFLFTKIRYFNHRVAGYVFRVIGAATSVLLVIFYLTYAHTDSFILPFTIDWPLGKGGAIMAHINLLLGIFITLLAAALDTPKD